MLAITFIRHGESTDNLLPIWAGWRDAPLSELGKKQADALANSLSNTRFDAMHASTLSRALSTAQAVLDAQPDPKPPLHTSPVLREQTRGIAEGHPWIDVPRQGLTLEEHYAQGLFPIHNERWQKFPGGESLDDLQRRAKEAVEEVIMPYIKAMIAGCPRNVHLAVASHGLLIAEMVPILLRLSARPVEERTTYRGMKNSGWTKVIIEMEEGLPRDNEGQLPIIATLSDFNRHEHLDNLATTSDSGDKDAVQTYSISKL